MWWLPFEPGTQVGLSLLFASTKHRAPGVSVPGSATLSARLGSSISSAPQFPPTENDTYY